MQKKGMIIVVVLILFAALSREHIMPNKKEITELELITVVGMDGSNDNDNIKMSFVRKNMDDESTGPILGTKEKDEKQTNTRILTIEALTYNQALRDAQAYSERTISPSHIRYFLIGEKVAREDLKRAVDFMTRDYNLRLNSRVYIIKGMTAEEFLKKNESSNYDLSDRFNSMELNYASQSISHYTELLDLLKIFLNKSQTGLLPVFKQMDVGNIKSKEDKKDPDKDSPYFGYDGYAIIKGGNLIDFLSPTEARACNFVTGKIEGASIDIADGKDTFSFGLVSSKSDIKFDFDSDRLSKITINIDFKTNLEGVNTNKNIFKASEIARLERLQEKEIKEQIQQVIDIALKYKCDFLGFNQILNIKHPYKYRKIEQNWEQNFTQAKIDINAKCSTVRAYDVMSTEKEEGKDL